jgi:hypothetical protein
MKTLLLIICPLFIMLSCNSDASSTQTETTESVPDSLTEKTPAEETQADNFQWNITNEEGDEYPYSVVSFSFGEQDIFLDTLQGWVSACDLSNREGPCEVEIPENVLGFYSGFHAGLLSEGYIIKGEEKLEYWVRYTDEMDEEVFEFELADTF